VRKCLLVAATACFAVSFLTISLKAQQTPPTQPRVATTGQPAPQPGLNAPRYGFAVVDVSYIFKNYQRFKAMMDQMKVDVEGAERTLSDERNAINQEARKLEAFKPGSPEHQREEERITELKTKFNLKMTKQRKEFLDRESKIYYQAYLEVNDAVKYFALRNNIGLVLRFNGDPVDSNQREEVLRAINKPVVFQNGVDITPDVLRDLDRGRPAPVGSVPVGPGIPGKQF